jgi:pimeloyl-ACP methyl ester carboxylesterase
MVIDASALLEFLLHTPIGGRVETRILRDGDSIGTRIWISSVAPGGCETASQRAMACTSPRLRTVSMAGGRWYRLRFSSFVTNSKPSEMLFQEVTMLPSRTRGVAAAIIWLAGVAGIAQISTRPTPRNITANGAELAYVSQGSGAPVVFVHGAVADLRFWEPQRAAFAKHYRFISYNQRYHGAGGWPDEGTQYSVETHAADLARFIDALTLGPVNLVGLSYGGTVAALLATKEPQLLRTLTLAEPGVFALLVESPEGKVALDEWTQGAVPMMTALKAGDNVGATKQLIALVTGDSVENFDKLPPDLRQGFVDNARTLPRLFAAPQPTITCDALRGIKVPTLIVRGERTPRFFTAINAAVSKCIAGSQAVTIPKASHAMSLDNPTEFNRAVMGFIGQHAAQTP